MNRSVLLKDLKLSSLTPMPLSKTSIKSSPYSLNLISMFVADASIAFSTNSLTAMAKLKTTYNECLLKYSVYSHNSSHNFIRT